MFQSMAKELKKKSKISRKLSKRLNNHQCYGENKKVLWPKHKSMKSQITFNPPKNPKQAHLESYLIIVQLNLISIAMRNKSF